MAVQYDRAMIDLVREIRKHLKGDDKLGIKLANPELLAELFDIYQRLDEDVVTKTLIRELYSRAGDDWLNKIDSEKPNKRYISKQYRGTVQLVEAPVQTTKKPSTTSRVYRGQVVKA